MGIQLDILYNTIKNDFDVKLLTSSCFNQSINWFHVIDNREFITHLEGNELIFNSTLHQSDYTKIRIFIDELLKKNSGGLIIAYKDIGQIPSDIISYCEEHKFPLFGATWTTSYLSILKIFSSLILENERKEAYLISSMKNAIFNPDTEKLYLPAFRAQSYDIFHSYTIICFSSLPAAMDEILTASFPLHVKYMEDSILYVLVMNQEHESILASLRSIHFANSKLHIGLGSTETALPTIQQSYHNATVAHLVSLHSDASNYIDSSSLELYQLLSNIKNRSAFSTYVDNILAPLIEYDKMNHTNFLSYLKIFFEYECNAQETSIAMDCHKNTLYHRIHTIEKILGYDITRNKNRLKIMLALYIFDFSES